MAFCTKCGAAVSGAFCVQCGTPAAATQGQAPPAQPYAPQAPVATPVGSPAPAVAPAVRKTNPMVWVLIIILGLFVLGGLGIAGVVWLGIHRVHQAGLSFDRSRNGGLAITARGADGKPATVEFGTTVGKLPSWVPEYPGSKSQSTFSIRGSGQGEGEGGNFTFTTSDSTSKVLSFYEDKCKGLDMKVNLSTASGEGGMIIATDEGEKRSLTVVVGSGGGQTTVNVTYGMK
ncbi:MAG TPA: hypothetical protein VLY04_15590 [Bryobacteraceae bacterium]|nr:hypothetical protein [Bryobacteraceae bacterium]